ncbi:glycosyltransferase [Naumannella halotolerans]|uniref:Glycosyltransferase involved in cell wall biosynthesis n=1 Tax=Naumannella halotolerans TaxID=993414 RepID=A0A4R7J8S9_9ACTN|nr:glycosyltransferase [Naumannella halotolerans]TDT33922.1 glycosyltransferase involved in cell wall biosynthesis [Naumannella halotolerans]
MTRRARVAVVSDYTLATLGGAENAFHDQVLALSAVADVLAICPPSERLAALGRQPQIRAMGVPAAFVVPGLGFPLVPHTARLRHRLRTVLAEHRVEVVHLHSEFGLAAAAIAAARELGIAVVQTVHTFFWQTTAPIQTLLALGGPPFHRLVTGFSPARIRLADRAGDSALRAMTLATARRVDLVISPSAHQADRLRAAGLARVEVVPNTVAPNPTARPVTSIDGPLRVLWIGRLADEKRILPFVRDALRAVGDVGADRLQVEIVGAGPRQAQVRRLIDGHRGITWRGRLDPAEIPAALERAHVTVLSSIGWDNQPMTVAESITALRGVIWCDPALTEGLADAGIAAFGESTDVLAGRLVELATDPTPVIAASSAAISARDVFSADTFLRSVTRAYRTAMAVEQQTGVPTCAS